MVQRQPTARKSARWAPPKVDPTLAQVVRAAADDRISLQDLARQCGASPLLRRTLHRRVSGQGAGTAPPLPTQAVVGLGSRQVQAHAIVLMASQLLCELAPDAERRQQWLTEALRRGVLAERLLRTAGDPSPEQGFATGFCLELGTAILCARLPHLAITLADLRRKPSPHRANAEQVLAGRHHAEELGHSRYAAMLPDLLVHAVAHHHSPSGARGRARELASHCRAADALADLVQAGLTPANLARARAAVAAVGLERDPMEWVDEADRLAARWRVWSIDPVLAAAGDTTRTSPRPPTLTAERTLPTLKGFRSAVQAQAIRARRYGHGFALMLVQVDHLDRVSRQHGAVSAERLMAALDTRVRGVLDSTDLFAHAGAGRFGIILPGSSSSSVRARAERVRAAIEARPVDLADLRLAATISAGAIQIGGRSGPLDLDALFSAADAALASAVWAGRNQVHWEDRRRASA